MGKDCITCEYADISDTPRTIKQGNVTIHQSGKNNVICTCSKITSITITDGDIVCSEYKKKEV